MATPATLPNTPVAVPGNKLSVMHTSKSHAEATNLMIGDIAEAWNRIGPGAFNPLSPLFINGTLVASVAGNALTIAIKTLAGTDPSATDPVTILFRSATAASGVYTGVKITAATSFVVSSGSTLGTANNIPFRLWVVAFNDAGTVRIGLTNVRGSTNINPLVAWNIGFATAEGGAGAADLAQVFYANATVSSKAYTILGCMTWESGLATAGTWSAGPTRIRIADLTTPLPGDIVASYYTQTGAAATGTTQTPADNTIPQITEGDQYMTLAIIPQSAANFLEIEVRAGFSPSVQAFVIGALHQDAIANALGAEFGIVQTNFLVSTHVRHKMLAGTTATITFRFRAGMATAGTLTFNGQASTAYLGGSLSSWIKINEVMA